MLHTLALQLVPALLGAGLLVLLFRASVRTVEYLLRVLR
jgi:hypothetical protein